MAYRLLLIIFVISFGITSNAQPPVIKWQHSFGGSALDHIKGFQQTSDSGFIICGYTRSNDGDVSNNHGDESQHDAWVLRLNKNGNLLWQKCLGGSKDDELTCILQTRDGHFAAAGFALSTDGDLQNNRGKPDCWLVILDASGNIVLQKTYGGSGGETIYSIDQTNDSGFIMAGFTESMDGDATTNFGGLDYWLIKTDKNGVLDWQKSYGNKGTNVANSVRRTFDGGYIIAGVSECIAGDTTMRNQHAGSDYWVIKTDANGAVQWQQAYGGSENDVPKCIIQSNDSNYVLTGQTNSNDGDVQKRKANEAMDVWALCLNQKGEIKWQQTLGGSSIDGSRTVVQCRDGGFLIGGSTYSNDGDLDNNNRTAADVWLVKLNANGVLDWNKTMGGSKEDNPSAAIETLSGGYAIAADVNSTDKDITTAKGNDDIWVVNLEDGKPSYSNDCNKIRIFPNPCVNNLHVGLPNEMEDARLTMHSTIGQLVLSNSEVDGYRNFDIGNFQRGLYFITLTTKADQRCTTKIILQ